MGGRRGVAEEEGWTDVTVAWTRAAVESSPGQSSPVMSSEGSAAVDSPHSNKRDRRWQPTGLLCCPHPAVPQALAGGSVTNGEDQDARVRGRVWQLSQLATGGRGRFGTPAMSGVAFRFRAAFTLPGAERSIQLICRARAPRTPRRATRQGIVRGLHLGPRVRKGNSPRQPPNPHKSPAQAAEACPGEPSMTPVALSYRPSPATITVLPTTQARRCGSNNRRTQRPVSDSIDGRRGP